MKTEILGENPVSVPRGPHGLTWNPNRHHAITFPATMVKANLKPETRLIFHFIPCRKHNALHYFTYSEIIVVYFGSLMHTSILSYVQRADLVCAKCSSVVMITWWTATYVQETQRYFAL